MQRRHPLRRALHALAGLLALTVLAALCGLPVYVFPATDEPRHAGVVLVLGAPTRAKVKVAQELVASGHADRILISVPQWGRWAAHNLTVCTAHLPYQVTCETPDPFSTRGEARMLREYALEHGVTSAVVVTSVAHITRSRVLIGRCFDGQLYFRQDDVPRDALYWVSQYIYQTAAFAKAAFDDC